MNLPQLLIFFWIVWLILVLGAVYRKWKYRKNLLFILIYGLLLVAFGILLLTEKGNEKADHRLFLIGQNFLSLIFITIFLQFSVWWFSKKWHRN